MAILTINFKVSNPAPSKGYIVKYRVKGSTGAYTIVTPNPMTSPVKIYGLRIGVEYEGTIAPDCGSTFSRPIKFVTCTCPNGYEKNPDGTVCYKIEEEEATLPVAGELAYKRSFNYYSTGGTRIYSSFSAIGTGPNIKIPLTNRFWFNGAGDGKQSNDPDAFSRGPLNRTAVWAEFDRDGQRVGFSQCLPLQKSKTYYLGVGCDNLAIIKINGRTIISQDPTSIGMQFPESGQDYTVATHNIWHVYPIKLDAGPNILEIIGFNVWGPAAIGIEIYDIESPQELIDAYSYADLGNKLIFSTKDYVGKPLQIGTFGTGYTCSKGYSLVSCVEPYVCRKITTIPCGLNNSSGFDMIIT